MTGLPILSETAVGVIDDLSDSVFVRGTRVWIDQGDKLLLAGRRWYLSAGNQQAEKLYVFSNNHGPRVYLHRLIVSAGQHEFVDHLNGDTLDNRKRNLRICNRSQNNANRRDYSPSSGYRGVYRSANNKRFEAQISVNNTKRRLGVFTSAIDAAQAYDAAAREAFGNFAVLNFPQNNKREGL